MIDRSTIGLHPELRRLIILMENTTSMKAFETWRSPTRQHELYLKGNATKVQAMRSAHQYGMAARISPVSGW